MGFGAIIASGENNTLLRDDLLDCLTEVRVEQFLDEPTRFAMRFQEDISNGEPLIMQAPELKCEQMITIAVQVDDVVKCLVRGPITNVKSSVKLGGPGSWHEVHGQDRRVQMDRECIYHAWSALASDAAETILNKSIENKKTFDRTNVEKTRIAYGGQSAGQQPTASTLNQRYTDLAFIRRIARDCNLHFWIEYICQRHGLDPAGQSLKVEEQANLKSSPPRPMDAPAGPIPVDEIKLVPTVQVTLRVNVEQEQCQNVTVFDLHMNSERPNRFAGTAHDDRDHRRPRIFVTDPEPPIERDGRRFAGGEARRDLCITTAGNVDALQSKAESALAEAGWFVNATASTTAHMLGGVLLPHDVVEVAGLGQEHSGAYQVKAVTHVINAADHFMDIQLRRNAIGRG